MTTVANLPDPAEYGLPAYASDAEARQVIADGLAALSERVETIKTQQQQAMQTTASATSRDGHVSVTVDATGVPTALTLAQNVFEHSTPDKLARTVLATVQQAAASARSTVRTATDGIRDDDEISAARAGARQLLGGDPALPDVPRTTSDPTGQHDPWAGSEAGPAPEPDPDESFDEVLTDLGDPAEVPPSEQRR